MRCVRWAVCAALFEAPGPILPIGSEMRTIADSLLTIATLVMASSLVGLNGGLSVEALPREALALVSLTRLVLIPAVGFACFAVVQYRFPILVGDRLTQFVILIRFAMTSHNSAIVVLQAYRYGGRPRRVIPVPIPASTGGAQRNGVRQPRPSNAARRPGCGTGELYVYM